MPYSVQQPVVSIQVSQLEDELGVKLFNRRPFSLTDEGGQLYDLIAPFFSILPEVPARTKGDGVKSLRVGASSTLLSDHLPSVLKELRKEDVEIKFMLRECSSADAEDLLIRQELDVVVTALPKKLTSGIRAIELVSVPMVLLVPSDSKVKTWSDLPISKDGEVQASLVGLRSSLPPVSLFQESLNEKGMKWEVSLEVSAMELIARYVGSGFGYGVALDVPGVSLPKGVRKIELKKFPKVKIGLLYLGKMKPLTEAFTVIAKQEALKISSKLGKK